MFIAIIPAYRSHIFFLNFVDEDDNLVIGSTLNHGNKLYQNIYSQHQPIQFVLSGMLQKLTKPDNILVNIKWHREFMLLWSFGWVTLLVLRFGTPLLGTAIILELTKISFLGNLFLAESFVLYPILYLMAYFYINQRQTLDIEQVFVIALMYFIALSLAPLWPLLFIFVIWLIYTSSARLRLITYSLLVGLIYLIPLTQFVNFSDYFHDVFTINYQFYIPLTSDHSLIESLFLAFIVPFNIIFSSSTSSLMLLLKALSAAYFLRLIYLIKNRSFLLLFGVVIIVTISNIRYIDPTSSLYGAFHLLPWYGVYTIVAFLPTQSLKYLRIIITILIFSATLNHARYNLFDHRDAVHDFAVHYSTSEDLRHAVSILAGSSQMSMWVEPVEYWPYWNTGVIQYSHMVNYYGWMDQTPPLRDPLIADFNLTLPSLVYSIGQHRAIGPYLNSYLELYRDNKGVNLYLRRDLYSSLTPTQLSSLHDYRFAFPKP